MISENCRECVIQGYEVIFKNQLEFTQKVIDSDKGLIRLLVIILGVVAVGAEVMKAFIN